MTSASINGLTTTYTYNGDGLRMSKTQSGGTTNFVWDVAAPIPEMIQDFGSGSLGATHIYGHNEIASHYTTGGLYVLRLGDGLGSTQWTYLLDGTPLT